MTRIRPAGQMSLDGRAMTEAELQRHVIAQARSLGWGITQAAAEKVAQDAAAFGIEVPALEGLVFHPRYSLGSEPGWPDLTLIRRRDRRLIFAELKGEKGVVKPRQVAVLDLLREFESVRPICGEGPHPTGADGLEERRVCCPVWIQVHVWRPSHLLDGTIEGVLQ